MLTGEGWERSVIWPEYKGKYDFTNSCPLTMNCDSMSHPLFSPPVELHVLFHYTCLLFSLLLCSECLSVPVPISASFSYVHVHTISVRPIDSSPEM